MKMGDVVSHTLNENARGLILTEGNRNTPQELVEMELAK
jgi:hypothetical protein